LTDNSGTLCYLTVPDGTDLYERALVGVAYYYWTSEYLNPLSFDIPRVGAALAVNLDTNSIYILDTTALLRTWAVRGRTN
jgi:hypothetical protein